MAPGATHPGGHEDGRGGEAAEMCFGGATWTRPARNKWVKDEADERTVKLKTMPYARLVSKKSDFWSGRFRLITRSSPGGKAVETGYNSWRGDIDGTYVP